MTRPTSRLRRSLASSAVALGFAFAGGHAAAIVTGGGGLAGLPAALDLGGVGLLSNGCSSVLLAGGGYLLASAHCAAQPGASVSFNGGTVTATIDSTVGSPGYDGNGFGDLSLSKLTTAVTGVAGYWLAATPTLPVSVVLAGYGLSGSGVGGADGDAGSLRYGSNEYEVLAPDAPDADPPAFYGNSVIGFDFDDGSEDSNRFGSLGTGAAEAMVASGDSGGATFVFEDGEWRIVGIHLGVEDGLGFGYGAIGYDTLVGPHTAWIGSVSAVPEPAGAALLAAGLMGVVGASRLRRQHAA